MVWFFGLAVSSWLLDRTRLCISAVVCVPLSIRGHINRFNFSLWPAVLNAYYVSLTITIKHINAMAVKRCSSDYCCFSANFMTLIFCCCCYVVHHYLEILRGFAFAKSLCAFCVVDFLSLTLGVVPPSVPPYQSHLRSCLATCCATICHLTCAHVFEKLAVHTVFYLCRWCFILTLALFVPFISFFFFFIVEPVGL